VAADVELRKLLEVYARTPRQTGPVVLPDAYLRAVERVEALPDNASGADKGWVSDVLKRSGAFYARGPRIVKRWTRFRAWFGACWKLTSASC
jgi:hypothetical protein